MVEFTGTLLEAGGGGHAIELPFHPKEEFGQARPRVRGTVNGTPLSTRLAVYGGRGYLGVRKEILQAAGIAPGDSVAVVLELDEPPSGGWTAGVGSITDPLKEVSPHACPKRAGS